MARGERRAVNQTGMDQVVNGLRTLGLAPIASETNFVYFDVGRDGRRVFDASCGWASSFVISMGA